jgi:uncharacterized Fe-S center protein
MNRIATAIQTGFLVAATACVLILAGLHNQATAIPTIHTTYPTAATITTRIVPCNTYVSHEAMILAQVDGIGPASTNSFCAMN